MINEIQTSGVGTDDPNLNSQEIMKEAVDMQKQLLDLRLDKNTSSNTGGPAQLKRYLIKTESFNFSFTVRQYRLRNYFIYNLNLLFIAKLLLNWKNSNLMKAKVKVLNRKVVPEYSMNFVFNLLVLPIAKLIG